MKTFMAELTTNEKINMLLKEKFDSLAQNYIFFSDSQAKDLVGESFVEEKYQELVEFNRKWGTNFVLPDKIPEDPEDTGCIIC